jgi:hypothetical protein
MVQDASSASRSYGLPVPALQAVEASLNDCFVACFDLVLLCHGDISE